jgi:hypothetical protein
MSLGSVLFAAGHGTRLRPLTERLPKAAVPLLDIPLGAFGLAALLGLFVTGIAAARSARLVACLDTMNPANVPFYEAHGLSVRHEVRLADDGPTVWSMATA